MISLIIYPYLFSDDDDDDDEDAIRRPHEVSKFTPEEASCLLEEATSSCLFMLM